jgi:predicted dehydrogenase
MYSVCPSVHLILLQLIPLRMPQQAQACLIASSRGCGAVLGAVAARKLEDAEGFAEELGCAKAYGGSTAYADMCADPDIDICYVGTITALHMEHTLMALRGGKHVVCEKPFAASPEEVATMYAAADEAGVMLQEGMWTRFFPATEHARTAMTEGSIGTVKTLQSTFPDRCYPIQAAPMVFGTQTYPVVSAAGSGNSCTHATHHHSCS